MMESSPEARVPDDGLILVVEDDAAIARMVALVLTSAAFRVVSARDGGTALRLAKEQRPGAVVLNAHLGPAAVGLDVLSALKADGDVAVLMMSGDSSVSLRIACIERGADDFLEKPFAPAQLERCVRFLLPNREAPPAAEDAVRIGDLRVDTGRQMVFRDGAALRIGGTGWSLLEMLLAQNGEAVLYRELLSHALGRRHAQDVDLLRACIERLRSRIDSPTSGSKIVDFHGVGYALGYAAVRPSHGGGK